MSRAEIHIPYLATYSTVENSGVCAAKNQVLLQSHANNTSSWSTRINYCISKRPSLNYVVTGKMRTCGSADFFGLENDET